MLRLDGLVGFFGGGYTDDLKVNIDIYSNANQAVTVSSLPFQIVDGSSWRAERWTDLQDSGPGGLDWLNR